MRPTYRLADLLGLSEPLWVSEWAGIAQVEGIRCCFWGVTLWWSVDVLYIWWVRVSYSVSVKIALQKEGNSHLLSSWL